MFYLQKFTYCSSIRSLDFCPRKHNIVCVDCRSPSCVAFWRVDNSVGTFLPVDPISLTLMGKAYELRCIKYDYLKPSSAAASSQDSYAPGGHLALQPDQSVGANSNRRYEPVASFELVWWNQASNSRKRLSIWRPVVPAGMVYFGDVAVKGCVSLIIFPFSLYSFRY